MNADELTSRPAAMRAARRMSALPLGAPVTPTTTRSRVSHASSMPCPRGLLQRLLDPVGDPDQRELAECTEVPGRK